MIRKTIGAWIVWSVRKRWGVGLFASLAVGAWLGLSFSWGPLLWAGWTGLFGFLAVSLRRVSGWGRASLYFGAAACLIAGTAAMANQDYAQMRGTFDRAQSGVVHGRIVDFVPQSADRYALLVAISPARAWGILGGEIRIRMLLSADELSRAMAAAPPDRDGYIRWPARVYPFEPAGNPGAFDARQWAMVRGWIATAYLDDRGDFYFDDVGAAAPGDSGPCQWADLLPEIPLPRITKALRHIAARWRCRLGVLPQPAGAVAAGLLLGQRDLIPEHVRDDFNRAGIAHVLAVSGLHVGYVLLLTAPIVGRSPSWLGWCVVVATVLLFIGLVDGPASTWRAGLTAVLAATARVLGRPTDPWHGVGLVGSALLMWQPTLIKDLGFQLSFLAVFGLLATASIPYVQSGRPGSDPGVLRWMRRGLMASIGASAATWPIIAHAFATFSWAAPVTNLIGVPLAGASLALTAVSMLAWEVAPAVGEAGTLAAGHVLTAMIRLAQTVAPWGALEVSMPSLAAVWGWYSAMAGWVALRQRRRLIPPGWIKAGKGLCLCGLMMISGDQAWGVLVQSMGVVDVWILDVGQGDSVLIRAPWNQAFLVDGGGVPGAAARGGFDVGQQVVVPALKRLGIRRLEAVINTHPHEDHLHGLVAVLRERDVEHVYASWAPADSTAYTEFLAAAASQGASVQTFDTGATVAGRGGLVLNILATGSLQEWGDGRLGVPNVNDRSIVLLLQHKGGRLLLMGDLERRGQELLLRRTQDRGFGLEVDAVMAPHHGAASSFVPETWGQAAPRVAVISVGSNHYGHPAPALLDFLDHRGVQIKRTDQHGAVRLRFWPWGMTVTSFR